MLVWPNWSLWRENRYGERCQDSITKLPTPRTLKLFTLFPQKCIQSLLFYITLNLPYMRLAYFSRFASENLKSLGIRTLLLLFPLYYSVYCSQCILRANGRGFFLIFVLFLIFIWNQRMCIGNMLNIIAPVLDLFRCFSETRRCFSTSNLVLV